MAEVTEKQRLLEALSTLPDDATLEDFIDRLCLIAKIEEGLSDIEQGRVVAHEEIEKQFLS